MSDFLSPAINERLKEKRMEFSTKRDDLIKRLLDIDNEIWKRAEFPESSISCEATKSVILREIEKQFDALFLDTIEKAKPLLPNAGDHYNDGFIRAVDEFEEGLKKEIGK